MIISMDVKNRQYLLQSSLKVALLARLIAKAIDLFIVLIVVFFFYPFGVILGVAYLCLSDSLQNGQSIGKRAIGFAVISLEDGSPCSLKQSIIRNLPFIIPLTMAIFPLWGWVIALLMGISLIGLELYLLIKLDSGHRLGDVMADTTVLANDPDRELMQKLKKKNSWFSSAHHGIF